MIRAIKKNIRILKSTIKIISFVFSVCLSIILFFVMINVNLINYIKKIIFYKNKKYSYLEIQKEINNMNGRQFELFCGELFKQLGYKVKVTKSSQDGGKDIILKKGKTVTYVECKRWSGNWLVGRECLQKLIGSAIGDSVSSTIFITTSDYNKNAKIYGKKIAELKLWNTNNIMKNIGRLNHNQISQIFKNIDIKYHNECYGDKLTNINNKINNINKALGH